MFNHAQESKKVSREKVVAVVAELKAMKLPETVKKVETGIEENQTYCDFSSEHWVKIQTNDVIERMLRDIRCRILRCTSRQQLRTDAGLRPSSTYGRNPVGRKKYINTKHPAAVEQEILFD